MRSTRWIAALGCVVVLLAGCATRWTTRDELLWHPEYTLAVPDLAREGWERARIKDAEIAFARPGSGVIAVHVTCPSGSRDTPLRWKGRELWLGVSRGDMERFYFDVDGYEAVNIAAESDGLHLRTLTVRTDECLIDVAQVAPVDSDHHRVFEDFVRRMRLRREGV